MARKQIAEFLPAEDEDVFEVLTSGPDNVPTSQQKRLDDIINDLNDDADDAEIRVYRQTPQGGKSSMIFLDSFPADKFQGGDLHKYLRDNYGGGDYRIHIRANGRVRANKLITIEAPKVSQHSPTPAGEASNILSTVLERMERQQNQLMQILAQQSQPQQSRREFLEEMAYYKQLFSGGGTSDAITQLKNTLGVLGELGITINGQAEQKDDSGFSDLIEKLAPVAMAAINQPQQPQQRRDPMFAKNMMLKTGIGQLMRAASKNSERITYAEMIMDQLDENTVREFITDPGAFEKIIKMEPRAAQFRPWFEDLAEHVKAQLGMPSKYADLYEQENDAINGETEFTGTPDDGTDHV